MRLLVGHCARNARSVLQHRSARVCSDRTVAHTLSLEASSHPSLHATMRRPHTCTHQTTTRMQLTINTPILRTQVMVLLLSPWILIYFMLFLGRLISRGFCKHAFGVGLWSGAGHMCSCAEFYPLAPLMRSPCLASSRETVDPSPAPGYVCLLTNEPATQNRTNTLNRLSWLCHPPKQWW